MAYVAPKYIVRSATNLKEAADLWWPLMQELGWNRGQADAATHFKAAENGKNWLLICSQPLNTPRGMVMPLTYPNKTGWVAFFIMTDGYRGEGLGRQLWKEMELRFKDAETDIIGLDAVQEQVETYKRRGFVSCATIPIMMREPLADKPLEVTWGYEDSPELQDLRDVDPMYLAQFDLDHTGLDRSAYWVQDGLPSRRHTSGFAIIENGQLTGLIYARRCPDGVRVGPLYAANYLHAKQLLSKLMNDYARMNGTFVAEVFGSNELGVQVFEELGWKYANITYHRMWLHGKVPVQQQGGGLGAKRMYAILDAACG
ncbi:acyl-CoA N-acyltransferase [Ampelomyces quisqualis]|uniref:Acyl-CoA N-acyltransferase n=1 Tax=Ampelomyces quisqualis TaxID=50730 RepID=A0A6A5Q7G8_AMPQU|nr:acyl-CoA N-acyltransferase [Ampelomyces quisqualis]